MNWRFELLNKPYGSVTEGPVWDGENLLFTHIAASRIYRVDHYTDEITVWREGTNRTNGLAHNEQGELFGCCAGGRAILRFAPDGNNVVIADAFDGHKLNTPNDLAVDRKGRIWFTNPWNATNIDATEIEEPGLRAVLCATPQEDGNYSVTRVETDSTMPNGILVSADGNTLYVAESNSDDASIDRELRAYPINPDGSLGQYDTLHAFGTNKRMAQRGIDGMCLDAEGNIIATAGWPSSGPGPLIYVFDPKGRVIETHPVPCMRPTNCVLGGPGRNTLYVTSGEGHLFKAETDLTGWALFP